VKVLIIIDYKVNTNIVLNQAQFLF